MFGFDEALGFGGLAGGEEEFDEAAGVFGPEGWFGLSTGFKSGPGADEITSIEPEIADSRLSEGFFAGGGRDGLDKGDGVILLIEGVEVGGDLESGFEGVEVIPFSIEGIGGQLAVSILHGLEIQKIVGVGEIGRGVDDGAQDVSGGGGVALLVVGGGELAGQGWFGGGVLERFFEELDGAIELMAFEEDLGMDPISVGEFGPAFHDFGRHDFDFAEESSGSTGIGEVEAVADVG